MGQFSRLFRSVLYIPASKARALDKARGLDVDAIIFDLEDAVAPNEKIAARATLAGELATGGYGSRVRLVRINGLDTDWGKDDARAVADMNCDALLLPKVESRADIAAVHALAPNLPVWCMIETPRGVLNAQEIADCPEVEGFILGTNDLAKELRADPGPDRGPLLPHLSTALLAAREAGVAILDGVYNDVKNLDGFRAECVQGAAMGFDGKTLIHPGQVEITNDTWAPDAGEIELAERIIAAFAEAEAEGRGVVTVDGRMIENLHVDNARRTLAIAEAIAAATET